MKKRLAIFASGFGTNAQNICNYFRTSSDIEVSLICSNNKNSQAIIRAKKLKIPTLLFRKSDLETFESLAVFLENKKINYLILAGFLLKIPGKMIDHYHNKILNIHPSLLPKYGGKGMYGKNVHAAVLTNNDRKSGITIHLVNNNYDDGKILFQKSCIVSKHETVDSLSKKVQVLEKTYFPKILEKFILKH